ncbi:MAG: tRNA (adenosine(37)-N6)-dimethylallyltransferase MiaA [Chloroflexota bacterium]
MVDPILSHPLIALVGPTAVGKSLISLQIAKELPVEIVSADSRLLFRGMDIGTAKPSDEELASVKHHLIDIADPDENIGLAAYQQMAQKAINSIHSRNRVALMVGGSGQYVKSVLEGWNIPRVPPNYELRSELEQFANEHGHQALFNRLRELDPVSAERIDARNIRRVVRAIEVTLESGIPMSTLRTKSKPKCNILHLGLVRPRAELYQRIDMRIDQMIDAGLINEVRNLITRYGWNDAAMSGLGYRQFKDYLDGKETLDDAIALLRKDTRRFLRQQMTWFRLDDPNIHWFEVGPDTDKEIVKSVRYWLEGLVAL